MSLFTNTNELNRQGTYNAPDQVTGAKKAMLAALGYKGTGESNTWGKVMNWLPGGADLGRNMLAGGIAGKGTDTNRVIKGQRDEAFNQTMSTLALGVEGVKLASGLGAGSGALSSIGKFGTAGIDLAKGNIGGALTETLDGLSDVNKLNDTRKALQTDVDGLNTDEILNPPVVDQSQYVSMPETGGAGSGIINNTINGQSKFGAGLDKINKGLSKLPMIGGAVNTLTNYGVSSVALNRAGTEELDKLKAEKTRIGTFNYL